MAYLLLHRSYVEGGGVYGYMATMGVYVAKMVFLMLAALFHQNVSFPIFLSFGA